MNKVRRKAVILYFDRLAGEGMVRCRVNNKDITLPIYASNIKGKKTWYPYTACVYYEKDQRVMVSVEWGKYATFVIGLTKGTLDKEKWARLDKDSLAFKCNSKGQATNGLMGKGASLW